MNNYACFFHFFAHHPVHPVLFREENVYLFFGFGIRGYSNELAADGQFAVVSVHKHRHLDPPRAAVVDQGIQGSADSPSGIEHIIDKDKFQFIDAKRQIGPLSTG